MSIKKKENARIQAFVTPGKPSSPKAKMIRAIWHFISYPIFIISAPFLFLGLIGMVLAEGADIAWREGDRCRG